MAWATTHGGLAWISITSLRASARRYPDKEALVHGEERLSYREADARVSALADGLRGAGAERGDRVGIYLDASVAQALSIFAISRADGVYVPINGLLFPDQVAHIARDCQMKGIITTREKLVALRRCEGDPSLEFLVWGGSGAGRRCRSPSTLRGSVRRPAPLPGGTTPSRRTGRYPYTSGSTGKPKGVMLSHAQVIAGSSIVSTYLEITEADRILAVLPFSFDAGMNQLMTAWQQGATMVLITFVFAREVVQTLVKERVTGLAGVPTFWSLMAQPSSSLSKQSPPALRYITNTGGPCSALARNAPEIRPDTRVHHVRATEAFRPPISA